MVQRIIEIRDNVTKDISIVLYAGIFVILQRAYQWLYFAVVPCYIDW